MDGGMKFSFIDANQRSDGFVDDYAAGGRPSTLELDKRIIDLIDLLLVGGYKH